MAFSVYLDKRWWKILSFHLKFIEFYVGMYTFRENRKLVYSTENESIAIGKIKHIRIRMGI